MQAVNGFEGLRQYMTTGGNYDKNTAGAPLAYKLRYLSDNASAEVVKAQNYVVRTCEELEPEPGHYGLRNDGWYVARWHVYYTLNGVDEHQGTGDITKGSQKAFEVPGRATNVWVRAEYLNWFRWSDIFRYPASGGTAKPEVKCWRVTGTTGSTGYSAIDCTF